MLSTRRSPDQERLDHLIAEVSAGASEADAVEPSLTLTVASAFAWPQAAVSDLIFPACASESGAALKARLAKSIGYLASDVVVLHGDSEVDGEMSLAEMYIGAQSILSIRLRRRGTDLALASDALAPFLPGRVEDHPPAPPGSAEDLERYHESSFALNCVEETPCAPILLRLLQLRNGVVPDARAPCAADACAAPPNADELLDHLKPHPSVLLLGVSDDVEQSLKVGDRSIDSTNTDAEERRLVCAQLGGEFSDDVDQSVILAAAAAAAAASIEADPRASVAPAAAAAAAAARKAEAAAAADRRKAAAAAFDFDDAFETLAAGDGTGATLFHATLAELASELPLGRAAKSLSEAKRAGNSVGASPRMAAATPGQSLVLDDIFEIFGDCEVGASGGGRLSRSTSAMKLELGGLDDVDVSAMLANVGAHVMAEAATAAPVEARRTGSDDGNTSELSGPSENGSGAESEAQSEATRMTEELPAAKADEPKPWTLPAHLIMKEAPKAEQAARGAGESPPPSDKKRARKESPLADEAGKRARLSRSSSWSQLLGGLTRDAVDEVFDGAEPAAASRAQQRA